MKRSNRNNLNKIHRIAAVWLFVALVQTVCMAAPLVIYDEANLGGTGSDVTLTYTVYSDSGIPGGLNDLISSFQLDQGYMAVVADPEDGVGISKTYIANDGPLTVNLPAELDNNISFIRVVPWENVTKKAYCGDVLAQPDWLGVGSYYRWWITVAAGSGQPAGQPKYVPMAYNGDHYDDADINNLLGMDQVSHVLGLNEPDNTAGDGGTGVPVWDAINKFPNLQKTGLRIGSPSCTEGHGVGDPDTQWLPDFMQQADAADIRVDYIGVHWYDWGSSPVDNPTVPASEVFSRFKTYLSQAYAQYRRPIWITEFNANKNRSTEIQNEFLQLALPYLETLGYVERYMYFQPFGGNGDFFDANDDLTDTGQIYKGQASTPSYTSKTLPAPWLDQDIGTPAAAGDTIYANGNFTVCGGGEGITGTADEFRYVYQPLTGDGEIVARINSLVWRDNLSMGGVMIRESLDTGSRHAGMFISKGSGAVFQYRSATNGTASSSTQAGINPPNWVKLVRQGDILTGYYSLDGSSWTQVGDSQTIPSMSATVYIGLAACSYNDDLTTDGSGKFCDAVITDVSLLGGLSNTPPTANAGNDQTVTDSDGNGSESVALDGSGSSDSDGTIDSYVWEEDSSQIATGVNPSVSLSVGEHTITLTVTDDKGATATDTVVVTVNVANVTLVGGSLLNGDFNADPDVEVEVDFAGTTAWYNLAGAQTVAATKDDLTYIDNSQNAVFSASTAKIFGLDTGYPMAEGDVFDVSYVWRDAWNWVDGSDRIRVSLFVTADNTLTGVRTDRVAQFSPTSTQNNTYEAVDQDGIYTAVAADEGKTLFVAIDATCDSGAYARLDNFELILIPAAPVLGYDGWKADYEMTGDLSISTNDYDSDGLNNLYEYGLDGNPTNAAVTGTDPTGSIIQLEGVSWVKYIHLERTNTGHGLTYAIQWTADLVDQPWSNCVDVVVDGTGDASNSDFMTVTNLIPTDGKTQEFLRLRIEQ